MKKKYPLDFPVPRMRKVCGQSPDVRKVKEEVLEGPEHMTGRGKIPEVIREFYLV